MVKTIKNHDLFPGSKDWTQKYFYLVEQGKITFDGLSLEACSKDDLHLLFLEKGILFGVYSSPLFFEQANTNQWTKNEQLKFVLFESLICIFLRHHKAFDITEFKNTVNSFYSKISETPTSSFSPLSFLDDKSSTAQLEKYLETRCEIKSSLLSTNRWINYIENSYIFLDLVLYDYYLTGNQKINEKDLANLKFDTLISVIKTTHVTFDSEQEKNTIFNYYLSSSGLSTEKKVLLKNKFNAQISLKDFHKKYFEIELFRYFLLDIAIFINYFAKDFTEESRLFLIDVARFLQIDEEHFLKAKIKVQQFAMRNKDFIPSLTDSSYDKMLSKLSNRWLKIIARNKDKLVAELAESKELIALVAKATKSDLTNEEKKKAIEQFKDVFLKSMPSLAIFMLPGGALLLPLILKLIPALLPSSFRDNEV